MKLADFLTTNGLPLDLAVSQIGGVSVSGLRKWLANERVPRPDQMRRIFDWSNGAVTPNDFVLDGAHQPLTPPLRSKHHAIASGEHEKPGASLSQAAAR